jgi:hypothetical protein
MVSGRAFMATAAEVGFTAAAALIALVLIALLFFIGIERACAEHRALRDKRRKAAERKKRRGKGKKRGGKRRPKKKGYGLIGCRHCHKRYTNPRGHVCQLSWSQMQKVRK